MCKNIYVRVKDITGVELSDYDATAESLTVEVCRGDYSSADEVITTVKLTDSELVFIDRETMRDYYMNSVDDFPEDEEEQDDYIDEHLDEYYNDEAASANEGGWYTYSVLGDSAVDEVRSVLHYEHPNIYNDWLEQGE